jgi:hypothetical protein
MIEGLNIQEVKKNAFNGDIYRVPVKEIDSLYMHQDAKFSKSGESSFLRAINTPKSYFKKHPARLQADLLTSSKSQVKGDHMLLLVRQDEIVYTCLDNGIEQIDPGEKFGLHTGNGWFARTEDLSLGSVQYVYLPQDLDDKQFVPTMYIDMPIMYSKELVFEAGLFRVLCTNGMLDRVNSSALKLKPQEFNETMFQALFDGVSEGLKRSFHDYQNFLDYLENGEYALPDAKVRTIQLKDSNIINNNVKVWAQKYFDLVEKQKEVDPLLPATIGTKMDFLNLLTFYAQKCGSLKQTTCMEAKLFENFYRDYRDANGRPIKGIDFQAIELN